MNGHKHIPWIIFGVLFVICLLVFPGERKKSTASHTAQIELQLQDETLIRLTDPNRIRQLLDLICGAKALGYTPKTYMLGPQLVVIGSNAESYRLELDLDSDLFRYGDSFYDYGPGNDNNAMPSLWNLLGLEGWPEDVQAAFPDYFASIANASPSDTSCTRPVHNGMIIGVWYPDWTYLELIPEQAALLLEALKQESPNPTRETIPEPPNTVFTLHIGFDGGEEFDLAYMGQTDFYLRDFQTNQVYSLSSESLRLAIESAISETKATLYD